MSDLTTADLDEVEQLLQLATPGPWEFMTFHSQARDPYDGLVSTADDDPAYEPEHEQVLFCENDAQRSANWELVQKLRNAAPSLLAAARRAVELEREVADLKKKLTRAEEKYAEETWKRRGN